MTNSVPLSRCNFTSAPQHKSYGSPPGHRGFGPFTNLAHHGVTLLRQPAQRVISGFHDKFHSFPERGQEPNITVYARALAGCSVRMLVRGSSPCGHSPPPSEAEVHHAKTILSAFQFVGLVEEWELTVCLWHARFGPTSCHFSEFLNQRPGDGNETTAPWYDVSVLEGFDDQYDGPLYEHAYTLFWDDVKRHHLTRTQCAAWKAACVLSSGG